MFDQRVSIPNCPSFVTVPAAWHLVYDQVQCRSGRQVKVRRWQPSVPLSYTDAHITVVSSQAEKPLFLGFRDTSRYRPGEHISREKAVQAAFSALNAISESFVRELIYLRTEEQYVSYYLNGSRMPNSPISWVKFAHTNGSFYMVSVNAKGEICSSDIEVLWDYQLNRRDTEEWDNDEWLKGFYGLGPQLEPPHALSTTAKTFLYNTLPAWHPSPG